MLTGSRLGFVVNPYKLSSWRMNSLETWWQRTAPIHYNNRNFPVLYVRPLHEMLDSTVWSITVRPVTCVEASAWSQLGRYSYYFVMKSTENLNNIYCGKDEFISNVDLPDALAYADALAAEEGWIP